MGGGTGMNRFSARFPERTFDVGIAEQHAVGRSPLSCTYPPVCCATGVYFSCKSTCKPSKAAAAFAQHLPDLSTPTQFCDVSCQAVSSGQVTFAAGLACEGLVPFCAIYSTFLQRGFDQVVHDVALQDLPGGLPNPRQNRSCVPVHSSKKEPAPNQIYATTRVSRQPFTLNQCSAIP